MSLLLVPQSRDRRIDSAYLVVVLALHGAAVAMLLRTGTPPSPAQDPVALSFRVIPPQAETVAPPVPAAEKPPAPQAAPRREPVRPRTPQASSSPAAEADAPPTETPPTEQGSETSEAVAASPRAAVATHAPAAVEHAETAPRFDADYLDNPAPAYPALSRRMGEEGKVVLRVFVDPGGRPAQVQIHTGSGLARLDQAAQESVARWRFVPARRGGEPVGAWVLVPIHFSLRG